MHPTHELSNNYCIGGIQLWLEVADLSFRRSEFFLLKQQSQCKFLFVGQKIYLILYLYRILYHGIVGQPEPLPEHYNNGDSSGEDDCSRGEPQGSCSEGADAASKETSHSRQLMSTPQPCYNKGGPGAHYQPCSFTSTNGMQETKAQSRTSGEEKECRSPGLLPAAC